MTETKILKFYEVAVAGHSSNTSVFTYHSNSYLDSGHLVRVPFGKNHLNGVVTSAVSQPDFKTKPLEALGQKLPRKVFLLCQWISEYYSTSLSVVLQAALPLGLHKKRRDKEEEYITIKRPSQTGPLTKAQRLTLKMLENTTGPVLLHGVTGSGKTRVYQERAIQVLGQGQSVLILVPEISLTPQMIAEFQNITSPEQVFSWHSALSESQRHKLWRKISDSHKPIVLIGARSAIFAPMENIGLIVIDECHESSYKQDNSPKYDGLLAGAKLAELHRAQLILGSATPSVTIFNYAKLKKWPILKMERPVTKQDKTCTLIDSTDRNNFKTNKYFSDLLITKIQTALNNNEQSLIFYNRRGSARALQCAHCGWTAACPNCHIPLILHHDNHELRCHLCNIVSPVPMQCPNCQQAQLIFSGFGTKRLESELRRLFPEARIRRFDADNKKSESLLTNYQDVLLGKVDIMVGTQILTKGLDLPKLSTLGVIQADSGLLLPDVFAAERTFQQLYQSIGRIGRGGLPSHAIIQTYQPDHPSIKYAFDQDYLAFYNHELNERRATFNPPSCFLMLIKADYASAQTTADKLTDFARKLKQRYPGLITVGPAPAFHEHVGKKYSAQLIVKSLKRSVLQQIAADLPANWRFDLDPVSLL